MKRGLVLSLCAMTLAALSVGRAAAQAPTVTLSLDLFYNTPNIGTTSGGSWQLLAKGSNVGIAGVFTQLTGINNAATVFAAPQPAFKLEYVDTSVTPNVVKPWNFNTDGNTATMEMLFGQVPVAAPGPQDLAYNVGVTTTNPDELGTSVFATGTNMNNAVLLAYGTFAANSTPAFGAITHRANVFTAQGTATNPPAANSILEVPTVATQVRNNIATLIGDANLDKSVGAADIGLLLPNLNKTGIWQQGDFNGDKAIGAGDLGLLLPRLGQSEPVPTVAAVPEPSCFVLAGAAVAGIAVFSRRWLA